MSVTSFESGYDRHDVGEDDLTSEERHFIRHALGLTNQKIGYRNFYAAGDGDGVDIGRVLVAKGLAIEVQTGAHRPDVNFVITLAGFHAVKRPGEKMDREESERMMRRHAKPIVAS
jgi:hypothetical protein